MQYATHTPTYLPPSTSQYTDRPTAPTARPSHRTAIIGMTGLALLLAAMGGIAFVRYQDTTHPGSDDRRRGRAAERVRRRRCRRRRCGVRCRRRCTPLVPQVRSHGAAGRRTCARAAGADGGAASRCGPRVLEAALSPVPQSVYDSQVPHGAVPALEADAVSVAAGVTRGGACLADGPRRCEAATLCRCRRACTTPRSRRRHVDSADKRSGGQWPPDLRRTAWVRFRRWRR